MNYLFNSSDLYTIELISKKYKGHDVNFNKDLNNHSKAYVNLKKVRDLSMISIIICSFYYYRNPYFVRDFFILSNGLFIYSHLNLLRTKECLIKDFKCPEKDFFKYVKTYSKIESVEF